MIRQNKAIDVVRRCLFFTLNHNKMKRISTLLIFALVALTSAAQMVDPVTFSSQLKTNGTAEGEIVFNGKIDAGWHVYSTNLGNGGPTSASLSTSRLDGVELVGGLTPKGNEISKHDPLFNMNVRYFENNVQFVQKVRFTKPDYNIDAALEYGACDDNMCLPPQEVSFKQSGKSPAVASPKEEKNPDEIEEKSTETEKIDEETADETLATDTTALALPDTLLQQIVETDSTKWWQPVIDQLEQTDTLTQTKGRSWLYIFLMGLLGGLLALFTPCVWPIIPMTVSFFLKRSGNRRKAIRDAITYGISIIVIYLSLGLIITALFGSDALNSMSTNVWFNLFLFALLVIFALSFFGWFEIKLPASWGNKIDTKASNTSGLISIFLMAFTLALVSFSCTAPIVGLLLVETVTSGNWIGPAIGMFGFALALALPFTLFALFPAWLKQAPKSGGWMNIIKVSLGFIELAFALKFFSVADLAYGWHIMDREVFLALWIVIFGLLGLYLIGKLKFPSDLIGEERKAMPVPCIMLGLLSLAFAVYMIPGLWGAPCKAVSAFAPPMYTQDFNLNKSKMVVAKFHDYDEGMAAAKAMGKPVLIDFTGFGCVNCRKMEAAVWTDPEVAKILQDDYVLISLYVDDKKELAEPMTITANGETRTLNTVAKKWSYLQAMKFGANTQPFYVALDNDGNPLTGAYSYKEDVKAYLNFLNEGLKNYKK